MEHEGEVDRGNAPVASHANAKPRSVTNQCDRLISEEPDSSSHSPFVPRGSQPARGPLSSHVFHLPPSFSSDRNPNIRFSVQGGQTISNLLNVHFASNPDITASDISKDPAPGNVSRDPRTHRFIRYISHPAAILLFDSSRLVKR